MRSRKVSVYVPLFLLSVATLIFEINLTRIFSVAQFYHFAFMIVSLALLGFGASGSFLSLFPRLQERDPVRPLILLSWGFVLTTVGSYLLTLYVPFDSYRIAREWRQGLVLALHYVALATPFFCSGAAVGLLLAARPGDAHRIYAANMTGSALGCLLSVVVPSLMGGEGTVLFAAALGILATVNFRSVLQPSKSCFQKKLSSVVPGLVFLLLILAAIWTPPFFKIRLSPYKSLSYALLYPDADLIFQRWNGFSRVDVVRSQSIRSLPGRGFDCLHQPPPQLGLTIDGGDMSPITHVPLDFRHLDFTDCLLLALPYRLQPGARALVLEPRGGFDVLVALAEDASEVTVVEANPLVVEAVQMQGEWAGDVYNNSRVRVVMEKGRSYARRTRERFDVVVLSLTTPQRPITSGAYSLAEDYRYTIQAFLDYQARVDEGGMLVISRWLQVPPSESVRAFALAVEAVERAGNDPRSSIVALRSYQQMLILVRQGTFKERELEAIRAFTASRAFDLVYLPDVRSDEVNRYNVMPEADYYRACVGLLEAEDRSAWYRDYPFDVRPPTDNWPFFGHFFKWGQASEVLGLVGHTWQPFGGAGYFVLLALLALAVVAAGGLILLPLTARRGELAKGIGDVGPVLVYFALLGIGYLFVEIPLLQRFILYLGHPAYAMATVLFALLLFSGVGSQLSHRVPLQSALVLLPLLVGGYALGLPALFEATLAAPLPGRFLVAIFALAPPGFLMGIPFPKGVALLERRSPHLVAWAWGVNGAISVVASILAALVALSLGFVVVLVAGAICYLGAWATARAIRALPRCDAPQRPCQ